MYDNGDDVVVRVDGTVEQAKEKEEEDAVAATAMQVPMPPNNEDGEEEDVQSNSEEVNVQPVMEKMRRMPLKQRL